MAETETRRGHWDEFSVSDNPFACLLQFYHGFKRTKLEARDLSRVDHASSILLDSPIDREEVQSRWGSESPKRSIIEASRVPRGLLSQSTLGLLERD